MCLEVDQIDHQSSAMGSNSLPLPDSVGDNRYTSSLLRPSSSRIRPVNPKAVPSDKVTLRWVQIPEPAQCQSQLS
ncbi:hypothetical protein LINPERHAP1_LOCUS22393, partial [Linum perenne]